MALKLEKPSLVKQGSGGVVWMYVALDRQGCAPLSAAAENRCSAVCSTSALKEAMGARSFALFWLICSLHGGTITYFGSLFKS